MVGMGMGATFRMHHCDRETGSTRRRPLFPLFLSLQVMENPVHHLVLGDEGDELHLGTARRAYQRIVGDASASP